MPRCVNYLKDKADDLGLTEKRLSLQAGAAIAARAASAGSAVADLFIISLVVATRHECSGRLVGVKFDSSSPVMFPQNIGLRDILRGIKRWPHCCNGSLGRRRTWPWPCWVPLPLWSLLWDCFPCSCSGL